MSSKPVNKNFFVICACAAMMSALALTGCSERTNEQRYESPADDTTIESNGEGTVSSEDSTASSEESETSSSDESQPDEMLLDQQLLETVEKEKLCVRVYLRMEVEALREEYKEKYPNIAENDQYWVKFFGNRGEQIIKEFVRDHNIDYESIQPVGVFNCSFCHEFDKDTVSLMLNDPRVSEIYYYPAGFAIMTDRV